MNKLNSTRKALIAIGGLGLVSVTNATVWLSRVGSDIYRGDMISCVTMQGRPANRLTYSTFSLTRYERLSYVSIYGVDFQPMIYVRLVFGNNPQFGIEQWAGMCAPVRRVPYLGMFRTTYAIPTRLLYPGTWHLSVGTVQGIGPNNTLLSTDRWNGFVHHTSPGISDWWSSTWLTPQLELSDSL